MNPWSALESIPRLTALTAGWLLFLGQDFDPFKKLCLQSGTIISTHVPCPNNCGCDHFIQIRPDKSAAVGACCCNPPTCPDIPLTIQEITPWALDWNRLAYAVCSALDCAPKFTDLEPPNTKQIGSWSTEAVPVILSIQSGRSDFRAAVAHLTATQDKPFILLAPTSTNLDAVSRGLLHHARAAFFGLDSIVAFTPAGKLHPLKPPGELFAQFTPQPKDIDQDAAVRAMALIQQLESEKPLPAPTTLTVFRLYCIDAKSVAEVARDCHCSKPTVLSRLAMIRRKTGVDPKQFRTLSSHLAKLQDQLSDSRARRIHRSSATDQEDT